MVHKTCVFFHPMRAILLVKLVSATETTGKREEGFEWGNGWAEQGKIVWTEKIRNWLCLLLSFISTSQLLRQIISLSILLLELFSTSVTINYCTHNELNLFSIVVAYTCRCHFFYFLTGNKIIIIDINCPLPCCWIFKKLTCVL